MGLLQLEGAGGLEFLKPGEMMNGARYRQVLEDKLELFMAQQKTPPSSLRMGPLQQVKKVVTKWFAEKPHIQLIKWLAKSPDLNPIENG